MTLHARRPIELAITIQQAWELFLAQGRKCALSGEPIAFPRINAEKGTASLDRIDSNLGYVLGNVQWVHKDVNIMKNKFDQDYFIGLCVKIASKGTLCTDTKN